MEGAATLFLPSSTTIPFPRVPPDPSPTTTNPPSFSPERKYDKPLVRERLLQRNAKQLPIDEDAEGMVSKVSRLASVAQTPRVPPDPNRAYPPSQCDWSYTEHEFRAHATDNQKRGRYDDGSKSDEDRGGDKDDEEMQSVESPTEGESSGQ